MCGDFAIVCGAFAIIRSVIAIMCGALTIMCGALTIMYGYSIIMGSDLAIRDNAIGFWCSVFVITRRAFTLIRGSSPLCAVLM